MFDSLGKVVNARPMKMRMDELKSKIDLDKKNWRHNLTTNCYAYALGLDVPEKKIKNFAYAPGTIGKSLTNLVLQRYFTFEELLRNIHDDFLAMGLEFIECSPSDEIEEDEWKIALFTAFYAYVNYDEYLYDYHFMRETKEGLWLHKKGYFNRPTNLDSLRRVITDPRTCYWKDYEYQLTYRLRMR